MPPLLPLNQLNESQPVLVRRRHNWPVAACGGDGGISFGSPADRPAGIHLHWPASRRRLAPLRALLDTSQPAATCAGAAAAAAATSISIQCQRASSLSITVLALAPLAHTPSKTKPNRKDYANTRTHSFALNRPAQSLNSRAQAQLPLTLQQLHPLRLASVSPGG